MRGHNIAQCVHCGKEWVVGDCIPITCPECLEEGHCDGWAIACPVCFPRVSKIMEQDGE